MALLKLTAHTPVGVFSGYVSREGDSVENCGLTRDKIEGNLRSMAFLVIYPSIEEPVTEVYLPSAVLNASVLIFEIISA